MLNRQFTASKLVNRSEMLPSKKRTACGSSISLKARDARVKLYKVSRAIRPICW